MSRRSRRTKVTATSFSYQEDDTLDSSEREDSDDESGLLGNLLGSFVENMMRRALSGNRRQRSKKKTPAKRRRMATAGPCCGQEHCAANMFGRQNRPFGTPSAGSGGLGAKRPRGRPSAKKKTCSSASVLSLDSDDGDDVEITDIHKKDITSKIDNFFKEVESSDEDFEKKYKKESKPTTLPKNSDFYTLSDDEADDLKTLSSRECSFSQPGTSGIDSSALNGTQDKENEKKKEDLFTLVDDIMNNWDDVQIDNPKPKNNPVETLEDLKKKTEEILGSVSTLIQEFNPKQKEEEKKVDKQPAEAPSCPVCFEPFSENLQRMVTMCGHMFCKPCIETVARTIKKCPTCRKSVTTKKYHAIYI